MKKKTLSELRKHLQFHSNRIGKERDALRKIREEIEEFESCATEALEGLDIAIDRISEIM